jgi:hypothetical protein
MSTIQELKNAHGGNWGEHPRFPVADWRYEVANDDTRQGYWEWVEIKLEDDPDPGPTYVVWIAELFSEDSPGWIPDISTLEWRWMHDQTFTCDDDPDGSGARAHAHDYARYLRKTYPCAYVAVLPAGKTPKAIHIP